VFTRDVVSPLMRGENSPQLADSNTRIIREGDVETDPNRQAPAPPPSLRNPGESLPADNQSTGVMRPVQMPKPHSDDQLGANPDEQQSSQPATGQAPHPDGGQPGQAKPQSAPSNGSQQPAAPEETPPANGSQQPKANPSQYVAAGPRAEAE